MTILKPKKNKWGTGGHSRGGRSDKIAVYYKQETWAAALDAALDRMGCKTPQQRSEARAYLLNFAATEILNRLPHNPERQWRQNRDPLPQ